MPGCQMDLLDLLSRSLQQPDDAWKSMDVIDASDFVYTPLLALEPQYLAYVQVYYIYGISAAGTGMRPDCPKAKIVDKYVAAI